MSALSSISQALTPPTPPESWECCGSDCGENCVYSIYAQAKAEYDAQMALLASFDDEDNSINPAPPSSESSS